MRLEREFRFRSTRTSFIYGGLKDVEIAPGMPVDALGFDGSAPIVIDHKTTKSIIKYAKSADDLLYDAQATLYALDSMARFERPFADLAWVYYQTEGASRAQATTLRLGSAHAAKVFAAIERVAHEAADALEKKLQPLDLPPNPDACTAYGGCPYRHLCNLSPAQSIRSRMSNSLIADLRKRVQGAAAPVPVEAPKEPEPTPEPEPAHVEPPVHELPSWATAAVDPRAAPAGPVDPPVAINPPEGDLPPPAAAAPPAAEEKPKKERKPRGRAAEAVTSAPPPETPAPEVSYAQDAAKGETPWPHDAGFTLYVDCLPFGRPAKALDGYIAAAQARMAAEGPRDENGNPVNDYRLAAYGRGAASLASFVCEALEGKDLFLDTRTPEGVILLAPLSARAGLVVRGLR